MIERRPDRIRRCLIAIIPQKHTRKEKETIEKEQEDNSARGQMNVDQGDKFRRTRFVPSLTLDLSTSEFISAINKTFILIPTVSPDAEGAAKVPSFTTPRSLSHATTYTSWWTCHASIEHETRTFRLVSQRGVVSVRRRTVPCLVQSSRCPWLGSHRM